MKKNIVLAFLSLILLICMVACNDKSANNKQKNSDDSISLNDKYIENVTSLKNTYLINNSIDEVYDVKDVLDNNSIIYENNEQFLNIYSDAFEEKINNIQDFKNNISELSIDDKSIKNVNDNIIKETDNVLQSLNDEFKKLAIIDVNKDKETFLHDLKNIDDTQRNISYEFEEYINEKLNTLKK